VLCVSCLSLPFNSLSERKIAIILKLILNMVTRWILSGFWFGTRNYLIRNCIFWKSFGRFVTMDWLFSEKSEEFSFHLFLSCFIR
jgi:hypothetical protein